MRPDPGAAGNGMVRDGKGTITKSWFVSQLRVVLEAAGLPQDQFVDHSFRIGVAATAAAMGIKDSTI